MGFGIALGSGAGEEHSGYSGGLNSLYFKRELWEKQTLGLKEGQALGRNRGPEKVPLAVRCHSSVFGRTR